MNKEHSLVAVYGSLKKGYGNHDLIAHSECLGTFKTEPEFTMYSLGGFPAIIKEGKTSITYELYKVDSQTQHRLNRLEGFIEKDHPQNFYNTLTINTPHGEALIYTFGNLRDIAHCPQVKDGVW